MHPNPNIMDEKYYKIKDKTKKNFSFSTLKTRGIINLL